MMHSSSVPILLTATIDPGDTPGVVLRDAEHRWEQYQSGLYFWLHRREVSRVVFCENSGFNVDYSPFKDEAAKLNKDLEIISYRNNLGSQLLGRGHGEGVILLHALEHSQILGQASAFYKVTGRLKVLNFDLLARLYDRTATVISGRSFKKREWADTRFFKMDKHFYMDYLASVHLEAQSADFVLGEAYARALKGRNVSRFIPVPHIVGVSGSGIEYHDSTLKYVAKTLLAIGGLYGI